MASQSFLGIDLGAGSVKLVELRNEQGRARLVTYGMYEVPLSDISDNNWAKRKKQSVAIIKLLLDQTKAGSNYVVSALPTFEVFSSLVTIPAVSAKEMANAIRLEAKKVVPRPIEQMNLSWTEIGETASKPEQKQGEQTEEGRLGTITGTKKVEQKKVLITAAPKDLVNNYVEIFKETGLKLVGLETEAIALTRSLIGRDPSIAMIVDIGAKSTNLSIIEQGIPVVNRGVNFGGIEVTKKMAEKMAIPENLVEQWKRDTGLSPAQTELSPAVREILDELLHEVQYMFQLYRTQFKGVEGGHTTIEKVVFAGGSAFVPGLANYLAEKLNVPVHLGDPWARIVYPEDLGPVLAELGPAMAVAVGLAMRQVG